jgi:23S rRNA (adenine2503-C2)-methyltransferase
LARAVGFVRALRARGVVATLRWSAAQQVDGGCGQLRARAAFPVPVAAV